VSWVQARGGVRVVVAHRSAIYAEALGRLLESYGVVIAGAACDHDSLAAQLSATSPDVVVLDGCLLPAEGCFPQVKAPPTARVVALAGTLDDRLHHAVSDGEVDGVVLTTCTGAELAAAISQVASGHEVVPSGWLAGTRRAAEDATPLDELTSRQREVLELLALGMDNEQIAARLYISRNTVKFHVRTIYGRLGVHNRVAAARVLAGADLRSAA
jgi:DNA-binding NarL/FixJ family response regulator